MGVWHLQSAEFVHREFGINAWHSIRDIEPSRTAGTAYWDLCRRLRGTPDFIQVL